MANLTLRTLLNPGDITKGAPLTNAEIDGNFIALDADIGSKAPIENPSFLGAVTAPLFNGDISGSTGTFSGTVSATDFNSTSDVRKKTNIVNTTEGVDTMRPVQFNWSETGKKSYGLIAQELEVFYPELVSEDQDGFKSVSYIPIIALLIKEVQDLKKQINELRNP